MNSTLGRLDKKWISNVFLLLSFWVIFSLNLSFEWMNNEQYGYGMFVPFIALYLLYLRWSDRPAPDPQVRLKYFILFYVFISVLLIYPSSAIFETNADWRLVIWAQAFVCLGSSFSLIYLWGGWPWVRCFIMPFVYFLFAVPWPNVVEAYTINTLLDFVTLVTVDVLNMLGIVAIQNGNLIKLYSGWVSMEEACSGVRSFQSSIMLGFFMGELFRMNFFRRAILLISGGVVAIFFNIIRTSVLSVLVNEYGPGIMDTWHDAAGNIVFVACLLSLTGIAFSMKGSNDITPGVNEDSRRISSNSLISSFVSLGFIAFLFLSIPFVYAWYEWVPDPENKGLSWSVDWKSINREVEFETVSYVIQDTLLFDQGDFARWEEEDGSLWLAYYFHWDRMKAAQLGGFHGPELCLPTAGWDPPEVGKKIYWSKDGVDLVFNSFRFNKGFQDLYVFFAQWDLGNYPYHQKQGKLRIERLKEVWSRTKREQKTNLQVIILGVDSFDQAYGSFIQFLDTSISVYSE